MIQAALKHLDKLKEEQGIEQGREEGRREATTSALRTLVEKRFGRIAPEVHKQIQNADRPALERWIVRAADAPSIKSVFHG